MEVYVKDTAELIMAINELKDSDEQVKIELSEGRYEIKETINLQGKNIKIVGVKDKTVLTGSIKMRIADGESCNSKIKCFDIKKTGISKIKPIGDGPYRDYWYDYETMKPFLEDMVMGINLYCDNKPMPVSHYPKKGFIGIKEIYGENNICDPYGKVDGCREGYFSPEEEKVYSWANEKNAVLVGYWRHDWAMQRHRIESIENGVIKLNEPFSCFGYAKRGHFYGINLFSELEKDGEWYYDHENEKLYIIPYENQEEFTFSVAERIFELKECENITFENIIFEETQKTALRMYDCNNIEIKNCTIRNAGSWAVIAENCSNVTVSGCSVYSTGGGGIAVSGGDRNTLTASGNLIENNDIYDTGLWDRVYTPGIRISGCGSIIRGNKVHDVPALGILFHGNNHLFEKNELYNTCYESNDCGGMYAGGVEWTCRGNVIRYNYFHDMTGYNNKGCIGLYFDDAFSSAEVYGNIFANLSMGILIGGGRDFKVHNNTFSNCRVGIEVDDRLDNWASKAVEKAVKRLENVPYKSEKWKKAYPELENILSGNLTFPEGTEIFDNVGSCSNKFVLAMNKAPQYIRDENNINI